MENADPRTPQTKFIAESANSGKVGSGSSRRRYVSKFYRDISSPVKLHDFSAHPTPLSNQTSPSSSWKLPAGNDLPPPPILSLEERTDLPPSFSPTRNETRDSFAESSLTLTPSQVPASPPPASENVASSSHPKLDHSEEGCLNDFSEKEKQQKCSLRFSNPTDVVYSSNQSNGISEAADSEKKNWVTVYGFSREHINPVIREFEKCGLILKHLPGPPGSNWINILYQDHNDVRKALQKNGMQISSSLMVGVKPSDPFQSEAVIGKERGSFMVLRHPFQGKHAASTSSAKAFPRPYYLQQSNGRGLHPSGPIATPLRSTVSKIIDLVFGI
eukprot:TRINITY_DN2408_c0_g1_i2.p1 TRINITY_DN2408_c0_g1~~TRINITY_DN2408_c0_g1_i2.p1  ORF type:complete len:330 (-),score=39.00 TRINITY_DN2408_c0_g1_i2:337-1326(-)